MSTMTTSSVINTMTTLTNQWTSQFTDHLTTTMANLTERQTTAALGTAAAFGFSFSLYLVVKKTRKNRNDGGQEGLTRKDRELVTFDANSTTNDTASVDATSSHHVSPKQAMQLICDRRSIFPKQYQVGGPRVPRFVLDEMLEAARWAPTHHLTQPWHFVIFETTEQRVGLGSFLAEQYKSRATAASGSPSKKSFSSKKYDKKILGAELASFVVAICVFTGGTANPLMEEVCSVACAVQNMHLMASAHRVGAYWSTSSIYTEKDPIRCNPQVMEFLGLNKDKYMCLGWMFVGNYSPEKEWPKSKRGPASQKMFRSASATTPLVNDVDDE